MMTSIARSYHAARAAKEQERAAEARALARIAELAALLARCA